jgi:rhodanese-related sulfurtransferase
MSTANRVSNRLLRIDAEELKRRMDAGEPVTILDVRAPKAWDASDRMIRGAVRTTADDLPTNPDWSKNRLIVAYCT